MSDNNCAGAWSDLHRGRHDVGCGIEHRDGVAASVGDVGEGHGRGATRPGQSGQREEEGDTIYAVDRVSEDLLIDFFEREIASVAPVVLIAEGLQGEY